MARLDNGDRFPHLTVRLVGGGTLSLPDDLAGEYAAVLFYRGAWCPYCNAQLAAFGRAGPAFAERGIKVVALSVDDEETTAALVARLRLEFPVGCGADATEVSAATGAWISDMPRYLQSTGFVLDPEGGIVTAVYSTGAVGRLVPEEVIGLVRYVASHA